VNAAFRALLYADCFSYPLTAYDLLTWGVGARIPRRTLRSIVRALLVSGKVHTDGHFLWVNHNPKIAKKRSIRDVASRQKFRYASELGKHIGHIPTVRLVTVTGSVAAGNASITDDIDFLVVAVPGTVWLTRLCVLFLIECIAHRRHPYDSEVANAVCLNMFLSADSVELPVYEHDIYSAYELLLMEPVYDKGDTYHLMLKKNAWARKFLPVAYDQRIHSGTDSINQKYSYPSIVVQCIEWLAYHAQLWYMKQRRTSEIIKQDVIRFHPKDARSYALSAYHKRCIQYKIPCAPIDKGKKIIENSSHFT
jgi:hypothetical protein